MKPAFFIYLVLAGTLLLSCKSGKKKVTLESLILEMTEKQNLTYFPEVQFSHKQQSSYNRKSIAPDKPGWDANADMSHFIRVEQNNGRREFVMFDAAGPGAVVRWWMTFYVAQNGTIRVYLDNDSIPSIEGKPAKVLSGDMLTGPPFAVSVHQGVPVREIGRDMDYNFYLPIPFGIHCKITYQCDSLQLTPEGNYFPDVFYNIGYRLYQADTRVETFTMQALEKAKPMLEKAKENLMNSRPQPVEEKAFEKELLPGDSLTIDFERNNRAVNLISVDIQGTDSLQYLRSTVLSASFDGIQTVWVPIGEFFGTGYRMYKHKTWMNETLGDGKMESRWIMPFQKNYLLKIINYGIGKVKVNGKVSLTSYEWKPNSMYFGAAWHEYFHIISKDEQGQDLNFVDIKGKGVYAGDQITVFNTSYEWWGEGDEKIFVDGETFPSCFGTGTEDYYGYAFGRPNPFSHPFISQPVGDGNEGNSSNGGLTVNMRHRSLDAIPFKQSINANMELWHWAAAPLNYAITTYWYVKLPFNINIKPDIKSVQNPVAQSTADFIK
jgi:hypothetical protein